MRTTRNTRNIRNYYVPRSDRYKRNKKKSPLHTAVFLIIISLLIVTGTRVLGDEKPVMPESYGSQLSLSGSKVETEETKMVSQFEVPAGTEIDEYKGIVVYSNGTNYMSSHGLNFSNNEDEYYFGYKWQCVEYVKRFYYEIYGHMMPDGAGNAKYFFNPMLNQGEFNEQRGLIQYENGGDEKPRPDDLLVFTDGSYGHVAIITEVGQDFIEVIQQNSEFPRERFELNTENGSYTIQGERDPAGWMRK